MGCAFCLDTLSGATGSCISFILECLRVPVERQILYLVRYGSNLKTFRERARELEAFKIGVLKSVDDANDKGEEIKAEVFNWCAETIQIEMDVEWLEEKFQKSRCCCHTWHLDWRTRHRLSRLAKKKTDDIDALLPKGKFDSVSYPPRPADLSNLPTSGFVPMESQLKALNSIMEVIKDETNNINIIGVHGIGGIGKTTLMEQVVKEVKLQHIPFDKILLVRVTETPNLRLVQDKMAEYLRFKIEEDDDYRRAAALSERLKQRRRVLIILDDLWKKLDLAAVGIPYGQEHRGCKVIVTSRFEDVCNDMESNINIPIEELTDKDRLNLFKIKAELPDSTAFDRVAEEVVRQCGKLPHAIVTIGRAMRKRPVNQWNDAIKRKRESNEINIEGIPEEVVLCVTIGYDQLDILAKDCLQFSCLFPSYYSVSMEELVIYGLVNRLFSDASSLGNVWNKMHPVVEGLRSSNLFLDGDREGYYRIHDDTRKVVKFIAPKEGKHFISEAKGWPEELQNCEKLSLINSNISKLPDAPECPKLLSLFLQNNALTDIPTNFFKHMRELNFLNLSYTNISSLPSSLECLEKLRSLYLENTHLIDASLIKEFDQLEILILKGSSIEQLPKGLEKMSNLKLLDLSNNIFLKVIPSNVISALSQLEELYIGNSFGDWEIEGATNQKNARFSEVASLERLTALYIHVKNAKILSTDFDGPWTNLKRFRICVNDDYWDIASPRSMHLKNLSSTLANWVRLLLEKVENLTVARSRDFEDLGKIEVRGLTGLISTHLRACSIQRIFHSSVYARVPNLEELYVDYCYSMKEVFDIEEGEKQQDGLQKLRELILVGLPKLLTVWKGNHSAAQVGKLKLMKVKECGKLRNLFSKTLAQRLQSLEHIAILKCDSVEEIVSSDNAEVGLEAARGMNSSGVSPPMFFQNLQKLIVYKCNKMKSVLPLTIAQGLIQLKELNVASCNQLEAIIFVSDEERKAEKRDMLPELKILVLQDLPKLDTIYSGEIALEWLHLEELQVSKFPNVKRLPLDSRSARNIRNFRAESAWFEDLQWKGEYIKGHLKSCLIEEERG